MSFNHSYDYNHSRYAESAPYVHPSRAQTMPSAEAARSSGVDFSAPVIHFGTSREVAPRQSLKDQHFTRAQDQSFLTAMTKEQKLHTIFVGGLPDELDDFWVERILKSVGKLRQWKRTFNGIGDPCSFGFAEYDDPENVRRALTLLQDVKIPAKTGSEIISLKITQDEMSALYAEDVLAAKGNKSNEAKERNTLSSASGQLEKVLKDFRNPKYVRPDEGGKPGKVEKQNTPAMDSTAAVTIMLSIEDELGDIPEEQRESIAKEITSFRERSAKRDQDRARQIAEVEARRLEFERASRQDGQDGRNGNKQNGSEEVAMIRRPKKNRTPFEEQNMTEEEIAQAREARRAREAEISYLSEVQRWHAREATTIAALNRESRKQQEEALKMKAEAQRMLQKLANFDDDQESVRPTEDFYKDRAAWSRARAAIKAREAAADEEDRAAELKEMHKQEDKSQRQEHSDTIDRKAASEVQPLRLSLATRRPEERSKPSVNAEAILEDDDDTSGRRRVLVPLQYDNDGDEQAGGQEELQERLTAVVAKIPVDIISLRRHHVQWDKLDTIIVNKLRSFTAKKIFEAIGVEEEDLISVVMTIIDKHGTPEEIESELTAAIGDPEESETITARIWRFLLILLDTAGLE